MSDDDRFDRIDAALAAHDVRFDRLALTVAAHSDALEQHGRKLDKHGAKLDEHGAKLDSIQDTQAFMVKKFDEVLNRLDRMEHKQTADLERYIGVLVEQHKQEMQLHGEGIRDLRRRVDEHDARLEVLEESA